MPYFDCSDCGQLFHDPEHRPYTWCPRCGRTLTWANLVAPVDREPVAVAVAELDEYDRQAMEQAIYSPTFLRAVVKRPLSEPGAAEPTFSVAVSDGDRVATIAVQIVSLDPLCLDLAEELVEPAVQDHAAAMGFDFDGVVAAAPLQLDAFGRAPLDLRRAVAA